MSRGGTLRVVGAEGEGDRGLAELESEGVTYGFAEFIATEEMARYRGSWWGPESDRLLVARVDDTPVRRWWISDPARPERAPQQVAYPAAGTENADVWLYVIGLDRARTKVAWDRTRYPYLPRASELVSGGRAATTRTSARPAQSAVPRREPGDGGDADGARRRRSTMAGSFPWRALLKPFRAAAVHRRRGRHRVLSVGERPLTGPQLHVRAVMDVSDDDVLVSA